MNDEPINQPAEPLDVTKALWQLRVVVCGLGAALLALSVAFDVFVWKQNRNMSGQLAARASQMARIEAAQQRLLPALKELAIYSADKPELNAVFTRFGMDVSANAAKSSASPASQ